jgi:hypothetical protein
LAQEHTITTGKSDELIPGKLSQEGKRVYQEQLQAILEPEHIGRFVAIEPNSGRYFLGDSGAEALIAARDAMPESLFFLARVGYPAAASLGGYGFRNR